MTEGISRFRLGVIGVIVLVLFVGLLGRLWFLQIAQSSTYVSTTTANRIRVVTQPSIRGAILDNQGRVIVENTLVLSIQIRRGLSSSDQKKAVKNLAALLNIPRSALVRQINNPDLTPYEPIPVNAPNITYDTLVAIKERPELYPGVTATQRTARVYPYGSLAANLLGYLGSVNAQDLKTHPGDHYTAEDVIGKDGVEQVFETELRGQPNLRRLEVDSRGQVVQTLLNQPAQAGNDVKLTMNVDIQAETENALAQGIADVRGTQDTQISSKIQNFVAPGGSAVVLDARTGSIVAMASFPTYPVNQFTNGIPPALFKPCTATYSPTTTTTSPSSSSSSASAQVPTCSLLNRATQGLYPPGSTFKLMTAIAALQYDQVQPGQADYSLNDSGCLKYGSPGNYQQFCNAGKEANGIVDLPHALTVSSDVYFMSLGFKFYNTWDCGSPTCNFGSGHPNHNAGYGIQNVAREFGFGRSTGSGLPEEGQGRIPDQAFKIALNQSSSDPYARDWLPGDSANVAIGQGDVLVTPLQLADAYAAFINGGTLFTPRLASQVLRPDGQTPVRQLPTEVVRHISIPDSIRAQILPGLAGVVSASGGTGAAAFKGYSGLPIAGKTGTAQQPPPQEDTAWFVGLVNPNNDPTLPQYVVVVNVEQAGFGGTVAAPIARRIMDSLNGNGNPGPVELVRPQAD
ncbi:MAG TPA: penicillin-binding transpeptidase domain-containing protein [Acidimicrobiia bacterium]|nr:penicillin-binding transpeptidase domain-containing protein [Acidimicrobiia bacterium]